MTTTITSNKLERLLNLSSTITAASTTNNKDLTLKQLIPVHESLLGSVFFDSDITPLPPVPPVIHSLDENDDNNDDNDQIQQRLQRIVKQQCVDSNEVTICISILSTSTAAEEDGSNTPPNVLLVLQYLLRLSRLRRRQQQQNDSYNDNDVRSNSRQDEMEYILEGLTSITFPILMISSTNYESSLRESLVDASFYTTSNRNCKTTKPNTTKRLEALLTNCTAAITSSTRSITSSLAGGGEDDTTMLEWVHTVVELSSRLLTRILTHFDNDPTDPCRKLILDSMHQITMAVLHSTCYYSTTTVDGGGSTPYLANGCGTTLIRPVTALLLPALFPSGDGEGMVLGSEGEDRLLELWEFLVNILLPVSDDERNEVLREKGWKRCRTWENTAPTVATGILSVLIPSVQQYTFPTPTTTSPTPLTTTTTTTTITTPPKLKLVHQSFLWDFLAKTLQSGVKTSDDWAGMKGGAGFGDMSRRTGRGGGGEDVFLDDHMLVRRRTIYIMQLLIDAEHELQKQQQKTTMTTNDGGGGGGRDPFRVVVIWKKYMLCFEMLEMEKELHLVDQIWDTVLELCVACSTAGGGTEEMSSTGGLSLIPPMSWEWVGSLLARVLLSDTPTLRKLALFRFLIGRAGVSMSVPTKDDSTDPCAASVVPNTTANTKKGKHKLKSRKSSLKPAPLSLVAPSFVLEILLPSYDSLNSAVGTGVQFDVDGVKATNDLTDLIGPFLTNYMRALGQDKLEEFVDGLLTVTFINGCKTKTLVLIFDALLASWSSSPSSSTNCDSIDVPISNRTLANAVNGLQKLFTTGSLVHQYRNSLMNMFATLLSHSRSSPLETQDPKLILNVLALFPSPIFHSTGEETAGNEELQIALTKWLGHIGEKWVSVVGATCAASFISGDLLPFTDDASRIPGGTLTLTAAEQTMGSSIAKLCALSAGLGKTGASSMLWPAISRGLSSASVYSQVDHLFTCDRPQIPTKVMYKIARALLLLQYGCNECVLSGMGHGDLIVDKRSESMLPPPPNVELLLTNAMNFIFYQISSLCNLVGADYTSCGSARSGASKTLSSHFSVLIDQSIALKNAYPSSAAIPIVANDSLSKFLEKLVGNKQEPQAVCQTDSVADMTIDRVRYMSLAFAALTFGAEIRTGNEDTQRSPCADCRILLKMTFIEPQTESHGIAQWQLKAIRSIFQLAKWGALSYLVPLTLSALSQPSAIDETCEVLFDNALESVNAAPPSALLALFETSVVAAKHSVGIFNPIVTVDREVRVSKGLATTLNKILDTLFSVMDDTLHNPTKVYMLEKMCKLIFCPRLLLEEYRVIEAVIEKEGEYHEDTHAPILKAFHKLVKMAGIKKPYILKYALSYIIVAWLGVENNQPELSIKKKGTGVDATSSIRNDSDSNVGLAAIPYREDIAKLLVHKEMKLDECASHQEGLVHNINRRRDDDSNNALCIASVPAGTPETSTARAFLLIFLSKLPDIGDGISNKVITDLCHYLIFWLLDNITCCPTPERGSALMTGSVNYSRKIRAWQSLCLLARFVTADVADAVMKKVFTSMSQTMHGQIRYFLEAFTIQCARLHPKHFHPLFVTEIRRYDLPQQLLSSLMIIGGNLVVGRYSKEFLDTLTLDKRELTLRSILSGVIPWLGSTQGFCRAIAQLLAHKLIPHVLCSEEISKQSSTDQESDNFLKSIFEFLDINEEMKRLRQKQSNFFYQNDVDSVCTPEGILNLPIDEGDEANPILLVGIVKQCLIDIYHEAHSETTPNWKQFEDLTIEDDDNESEIVNKGAESPLVNFQRKILPLDSLNLALEHHQQRNLQNAAGRKRQSLIVCATLIDKIPNLAGLARTVEIFAAEKLVVPDKRVCKMDSFRSISVTAGDWIDIEECEERNLLSWLKQQKDDGYSIVGVEQTSSSKCLSKLTFPEQTVLLLGKEKEGIPVEFLQMVDTCVEIPQLGIIRSLNVHVSGAISIWEYSKQMMG